MPPESIAVMAVLAITAGWCIGQLIGTVLEQVIKGLKERRK